MVIAIIAILAGMLLPALAAAREKARRSTCLNNLSQFSRALESYCGDYSQYFPSWTAWGQPAMATSGALATPVLWDTGIFTGTSANASYNTVYMASGAGTGTNAIDYSNFYQGVGNLRMIFGGSASYIGTATGSTSPGPGTVGNLNMGPNGLGFLLSGNYIGSPGSYFCPTGDNMPPTEIWMDTTLGRRTFYAATNMAALKRAGAVDGNTMVHGDWSWLPHTCSGTGWNLNTQRWVQSSYSYRLVPTTWFATPSGANLLTDSNWPGFLSAPAASKMPTVIMWYSRPQRVVKLGEPTFKTQKQLGSRAVICDTFDKSMLALNSAAEAAAIPGSAYYSHRDGYNVLYGDWSARWYGDPQQRWMWLYYPNLAMDTYRTRCSFLGTGYNCLGDFTTVNYSSNPTYFYDSTQKCSGGVVQIWNALDQANGNDVSLPMTTP